MKHQRKHLKLMLMAADPMIWFLGGIFLGGGVVGCLVHTLRSRNKKALDETLERKIFHAIGPELLNFSQGAWCLFSGDLCAAVSPNLEFLIKPSHTLTTYHDFIGCFRPETQGSLEFFLKALREDHQPFYFQAITQNDQPLDIKAMSVPEALLTELQSLIPPPQKEGAAYVIFLHSLHPQKNLGTQREHRDNFEALKTAIDSLALPAWLARQDSQLVHVNPTYRQMMEQSLDGILKDNLHFIDTSSSSGNDALAARTESLNFRQKCPIVTSGTRRWMEIFEHPLPLDFPYNEQLRIGLGVDITQETDLSKQLQQHYNAFQTLLENLSVAIAVFGADTRLIFYNRAYTKYADFGEGDAWLQEKPPMSELLDTLHRYNKIPHSPDFPAFKQQQVEQFKKIREPFEELLYFPSGTIARLTVAPFPGGGIFYSYEDITDKLAMEEQYNSLMGTLNTAFENLFEGIAVIKDDGTIVLANPVLAKIWGHKKSSDLEGKNYVRLLSKMAAMDADSPILADHKAMVIQALATRQPKAARLRTQKGEIVHFTYTPLPNGTHLCSYLSYPEEQQEAPLLADGGE